MKKALLLLLAFFAPFFCRAQQISDPTTLSVTGMPAPVFDFYLEKNQTASLGNYKGKIVVIDFFSTWWLPCRQELSRLQKEIWEKYKDNLKFALFAFDREEGWDKTLPFKQKYNYTFTMVPDKGRNIFSLYATQSIPRLIVVGEDGNILYQSVGYTEKDFSALLALLSAKLK